MIGVPEKFERIAIELNGSLGAAWTGSLPGLLDDLMHHGFSSARDRAQWEPLVALAELGAHMLLQ